jgi:ATP adenylyltransferase
MEYINGPKGGPCIFCDFAASPPEQLRQKLVLVVQDEALVVLNRYPFCVSHLLVAPRQHVSDPTELTEAEWHALTTLLRESIARLRSVVGCEAMNVGFNLGKAAGAGIADHLHAHAVPRWNGDVNFMPVLADVRVMPEYLDDAWKRLYAAFADLPGVRAPGA